MDSGLSPAGCLEMTDGCPGPSNPLAQELGVLDPVSPGQVDRFGQADAWTAYDVGFASAAKYRKGWTIDRESIVLTRDSKRLAQSAGP